MNAAFNRYIGIDYSGAETCESSLKGLRVYMADRANEPSEISTPPSPRKNWTRKAIAHWLEERFSEPSPTLVGIDHGFSFPLKYFEKYGLVAAILAGGELRKCVRARNLCFISTCPAP